MTATLTAGNVPITDEFRTEPWSDQVMTTPIDLRPAAEHLAQLVRDVPDDALDRPTPCSEYTVGDLLDHIGGFALAFRAAAVKQPLGPPAQRAAANLPPDWRERIPADLGALADAWDDPDAWTGTTAAGGVDLPGEVAARVALDELVVHGWDLARALGRPGGYDGPGLEAVHAAVLEFQGAGAFGPEVSVADDAPLLDRILGHAGRDPGWEPQSSSAA
jgi:uncharacterized protein (TIGR03086 family)